MYIIFVVAQICAAMAQQAEHVLGKDEVVGSNPISSSSRVAPTGNIAPTIEVGANFYARE